MNNTYKVYYKTVATEGSRDVISVGEFECDKARYMYEIDKALKNGLPFTATDATYKNENGGRDYFVSIYIW